MVQLSHGADRQSWDSHHVLPPTKLGPHSLRLRSRGARPERHRAPRGEEAGRARRRRLRPGGGGWEAGGERLGGGQGGGGWGLGAPLHSGLQNPPSLHSTAQQSSFCSSFRPSVLTNILTSTKPSFPQQISVLETPLNKTQREESLCFP